MNTTLLEICACLISIAIFLCLHLMAIINGNVDYVEDEINEDKRNKT